eukprot:TRINITY_DN40828_c0_g1_i1.p1 TRINITY_DN40828_c0_g1~~TRINITY_DN40828_c0_g1_i1.p1  ORF type:complete len:393 (-),score=65.20 TRINITY_DN40828_c0_g1_i1:112-1290(-)
MANTATAASRQRAGGRILARWGYDETLAARTAAACRRVDNQLLQSGLGGLGHRGVCAGDDGAALPCSASFEQTPSEVVAAVKALLKNGGMTLEEIGELVQAPTTQQESLTFLESQQTEPCVVSSLARRPQSFGGCAGPLQASRRLGIRQRSAPALRKPSKEVPLARPRSPTKALRESRERAAKAREAAKARQQVALKKEIAKRNPFTEYDQGEKSFRDQRRWLMDDSSGFLKERKNRLRHVVIENWHFISDLSPEEQFTLRTFFGNYSTKLKQQHGTFPTPQPDLSAQIERRSSVGRRSSMREESPVLDCMHDLGKKLKASCNEVRKTLLLNDSDSALAAQVDMFEALEAEEAATRKRKTVLQLVSGFKAILHQHQQFENLDDASSQASSGS